MKVNWGPMPLNFLDGTPRLAAQRFTKVLAIVVAVVFVVGIALSSSEEQLTVGMLYISLRSMLGNGLIMSTATKPRKFAGENSGSLTCFLFVLGFGVHEWHPATVL